MPDATFATPDVTTFCRLDELGLVVVGQHLQPDRAVLACRVADDAVEEADRWCRRCGCEGRPDGRCARSSRRPDCGAVVPSNQPAGLIRITGNNPTTSTMLSDASQIDPLRSVGEAEDNMTMNEPRRQFRLTGGRGRRDPARWNPANGPGHRRVDGAVRASRRIPCLGRRVRCQHPGLGTCRPELMTGSCASRTVASCPART